MRYALLLVLLSCSSRASGSDGKKLFDQACARCHGPDGRGDPIQKERLGVPDMTTPDWQQKHSDEDIRNTIIDGSKSKKMPGFNDFFADDQIRAITAYVRGLRR